jgi:putative oxidoreductase
MISERYAPQVYALMRIVFGFLFIFHGLQKMFGLFGGRTAELLSLRGAAGVIEIVAGTLIMIGLYTRPAAFIASGQMAVAYFLSHYPRAFWPIENGGERAALFCFAFLYIATRGAGTWALDKR